MVFGPPHASGACWPGEAGAFEDCCNGALDHEVERDCWTDEKTFEHCCRRFRPPEDQPAMSVRPISAVFSAVKPSVWQHVGSAYIGVCEIAEPPTAHIGLQGWSWLAHIWRSPDCDR